MDGIVHHRNLSSPTENIYTTSTSLVCQLHHIKNFTISWFSPETSHMPITRELQPSHFIVASISCPPLSGAQHAVQTWPVKLVTSGCTRQFSFMMRHTRFRVSSVSVMPRIGRPSRTFFTCAAAHHRPEPECQRPIQPFPSECFCRPGGLLWERLRSCKFVTTLRWLGSVLTSRPSLIRWTGRSKLCGCWGTGTHPGRGPGFRQGSELTLQQALHKVGAESMRARTKLRHLSFRSTVVRSSKFQRSAILVQLLVPYFMRPNSRLLISCSFHRLLLRFLRPQDFQPLHCIAALRAPWESPMRST